MKLLIPALLLFGFQSFAQHPTCNGTRYSTIGYTVDSTAALQYGNNTTFGGNNQDLFLDFFEPSGDVATARPLIILAFGGSLIGGAREDMHNLCQFYTSLGYTAASIDYRLYDGPFFPFPDSVDMTTEVLMAVSDMKAAIRFFKEDAATSNTYRVDTNYIFVGGISAGGIVASHAALLDSNDVIESYIQPLLANNGGWTGTSSNNTHYTDNVLGVLNFSGALRRANYIDANDPSIFSVHDDGDDVVPYASGYASIFGQPIIGMEGSFLMEQQAQSVGINSELITIENSTGHVSYFGTTQGTDTILQRSTEFLYEIVCGPIVSVDELAHSDLSIFPNPAIGVVTIESANEQITSVVIYDQMGKILYSHMGETNSLTVNTDKLESGSYIVRSFLANGSIQTRPLLVTK